MKKRGLIVGACVLLLGGAGQALVLDLTTLGNSGTINGAIFTSVDMNPTGTGVFGTFVEVGAASEGVVQGYNTTVNHVLNNGSSDVFNHELLLSDVGLIDMNGVLYREFTLDVNQSRSHPYLSLDSLQLFLSDLPNQSVTTFTGGILDLVDSDSSPAALVYNMDAGADSWVRLNYGLNSGSGSGDMYLYVPDSVFDGGPYVYLYSRFGENESNNDGFEEWGARSPEPNVPEPATLLLMGLGLTGLVLRRKLMA